MYSVETAVRIALLENTSVTEEAIKSVQAAVKEMSVPPPDEDGVEREFIVKDAGLQAFLDAAVGYVKGSPQNMDTVLHMDGMLAELEARLASADGIVTITMPIGEPVGWIIEKVGHPISFTHYKTVADSQRSMGATVTPHVSRLV